jgi:hypothetical protein
MIFDSLGIAKLSTNEYVSLVATVLLVLYASFLGPNLPSFIKHLFNNNIFKIIVLFLLVVRGNNNPLLSIVIVIAFVLTLDHIALNNITEKFNDTIIHKNKNNALN